MKVKVIRELNLPDLKVEKWLTDACGEIFSCPKKCEYCVFNSMENYQAFRDATAEIINE